MYAVAVIFGIMGVIALAGGVIAMCNSGKNGIADLDAYRRNERP